MHALWKNSVTGNKRFSCLIPKCLFTSMSIEAEITYIKNKRQLEGMLERKNDFETRGIRDSSGSIA